MAIASDSRVESTSQSLKNQVESTSHTWSLWVVLALVLRSGCACLLVMFIFSYVLIANWILGKEFFIWWRTMQVKFLNFTLFGTYFRLDVLHSLIPFRDHMMSWMMSSMMSWWCHGWCHGDVMMMSCMMSWWVGNLYTLFCLLVNWLISIILMGWFKIRLMTNHLQQP